MITADAPSARRTSPLTPTPSTANAALPRRSGRDDGQQVPRKLGVEEHDGERDKDDRLDGEGDQRRQQNRRDVDGRRQGSGSQSLEYSGLAPDDEQDRKPEKAVAATPYPSIPVSR